MDADPARPSAARGAAEGGAVRGAVKAPNPSLRDRARGLVEEARAEALEGAATIRAARLEPPPGSARLQRLGYGFALPAAFARRALADPALRRRYLWVSCVQFAVTLGVGLVI